MEDPIKMDDFGVPLFLETPLWIITEYSILQLLPSNMTWPFFSSKPSVTGSFQVALVIGLSHVFQL